MHAINVCSQCILLMFYNHVFDMWLLHNSLKYRNEICYVFLELLILNAVVFTRYGARNFQQDLKNQEFVIFPSQHVDWFKTFLLLVLDPKKKHFFLLKSVTWWQHWSKAIAFGNCFVKNSSDVQQTTTRYKHGDELWFQSSLGFDILIKIDQCFHHNLIFLRIQTQQGHEDKLTNLSVLLPLSKQDLKGTSPMVV